jgi:predicted  nucleic acid-binding Zn-ribbon protein
MATSKAQQIFEEIERRVASGSEKAAAFRELAAEHDRPVDSIRGSFYAHKKKLEGGESQPRTRRRFTSPDDAIADARAALERALSNIDRELDAAKNRADEAKAEHEAMKANATDRKKTITERLNALK